MAAGTSIYNRTKANLANKIIDWEADTIKVALMDNSHSFTATDNTWGAVSANEMAGTGYSAGGATVVSCAVTQGATTKLDAYDASWLNSTLSDAYHAVIYDDTLANDDLIASVDFGGAYSTVSGTFSIVWSSAGVITLA